MDPRLLPSDHYDGVFGEARRERGGDRERERERERGVDRDMERSRERSRGDDRVGGERERGGDMGVALDRDRDRDRINLSTGVGVTGSLPVSRNSINTNSISLHGNSTIRSAWQGIPKDPPPPPPPMGSRIDEPRPPPPRHLDEVAPPGKAIEESCTYSLLRTIE